jgi:hypothetical protein
MLSIEQDRIQSPSSFFHFLMPDLFGFQNSIKAYVDLLSLDTIQRMPAQPSEDIQRLLVANRPHLGCYSPARSRLSYVVAAEGSAVQR